MHDASAAADDVCAPGASSEPDLEQLAKSIWWLTGEIMELLRTQADSQVQEQRRPDVLWLDDLTRTQGNTVIAIKELCDLHPEGVTLKRLAETIGVTPAAASFMVDVLVTKKLLRRTRSKDDRRAVLIRLTPETARLFDISERSLRQSVLSVGDALGTQVLYDWHQLLSTVSCTLKEMAPPRTAEQPEAGASSATAGDQS